MLRSIRVLLIAAMCLLVVYLFFLLRATPKEPHPFLLARDVTVIAHQGGDYLWPGNTLFALEQAQAMGVDVLELDIHASREGVLVVIHDATVDRTTNGQGVVSEMSLAELQALDAGYRWSPERRAESFPYRGLGIRIPSLEEVFQTFPEELINVEMKQLEPSIADALCDLIRNYDMADRVMVASFHDAALREFRGLCPEVATSAGPAEVRNFFILSRSFLGQLFRPKAEAFQIPEFQGNLQLITERFVRDAQRKNVAVHVWTVDETADMQRLLELGIDGIITDRPDRLLKLLGRAQEVARPQGVPE